MKIKTKLLGIIVLIISIIAVSLGVFAVFNAVQQKILSEKLIVTQLKDQLYKEASHISELCYTSVNTSLVSYREITQETINSFNNIAHIEYLKRNKNIAESLEQIRLMDAYMTSRRDRLFASGTAFLDTGTKLGLMKIGRASCRARV